MTAGILAAAGSDNSAAGTAFLIIGGVIAYFLPMVIGAVRRVRNMGSLTVVNVFLGWTLIGWVVALAMAFRSRRPQSVAPVTRSTAG
jgi:Superinfection immunity protein